MRRLHCLVLLLIVVSTVVLSKASFAATNQPQQGSSGITWAQEAMAALTGGTPVSGVTLNGSVTWSLGNNQGTGTVSLQSSGNTSSQVQLTTTLGNRSETRSWASDGSGPLGQWTDLNGQPHNMPQFNCWTDAVWFYPALSMLSDYADPSMVYVDLGPTQYNGQNVEHIQAYRTMSSLPQTMQQQLQLLSTVDYYLASQTALPVAMHFSTHGNADQNVSIPVDIVFSQYQLVQGVQTPYQITRMLNGSPLYQITISSVTEQDLPVRRP
jgi:hypothetical protein